LFLYINIIIIIYIVNSSFRQNVSRQKELPYGSQINTFFFKNLSFIIYLFYKYYKQIPQTPLIPYFPKVHLSTFFSNFFQHFGDTPKKQGLPKMLKLQKIKQPDGCFIF